MKTLTRILGSLALAFLAARARATDFYASPTGTGIACTLAAPGPLATCIGSHSPARAGDRVLLRGGTFVGHFTAALTCTSAARCTITRYPGEVPILDGYVTTTLSSAITSSSTSLTFASAPYQQGATVRIDNEDLYLFGAVSGNTYTNVQRGWNGTATGTGERNHSAGAAVKNEGGTTLTVGGTYTDIVDLEVMSSDPTRTLSISESNPFGLRAGGIEVTGTSPRIINNYVHDTSNGISTSVGVQGTNVVSHGNLCYAVGWDAPDRGHGHCGYFHNDPATGSFNSVNVIFLIAADEGMQAFISSGPHGNFHFLKTFSAQAGSLKSTMNQKNDLLFGSSGTVMTGSSLVDACTYSDGGPTIGTGGGLKLGYGAGTSGFTLTGGYFAGGPHTSYSAIIQSSTSLTATGNTNVGDNSGFPGGNTSITWTTGSHPTGTHICYAINAFETGRANLAIYSWDGATSLAVDFSSFLSNGDAYEVRNAWNFRGAPIATGTYAGGPVTLPLGPHASVAPVGLSAPASVGPEFNIFIVRKTSAVQTPTPSVTPTRTPTSTATPTPTGTVANTATPTRTPTATGTPTKTPTWTDATRDSHIKYLEGVVFTSTPSNTPTATRTPTPTNTPTRTPTNTPTP